MMMMVHDDDDDKDGDHKYDGDDIGDVDVFYNDGGNDGA